MENLKMKSQECLKGPKKTQGRVYGYNRQSGSNNLIPQMPKMEFCDNAIYGVRLANRELFIPYNDNLGKAEKSYFKVTFLWIVKLLAVVISIPINIIYYGIIKPYRFLKYCYQILRYAVFWTLVLIYKILRFIVITFIITVLSIVAYHIFFLS